MMARYARAARQGGYTLFELAVVAAVFGILMMVLLGRLAFTGTRPSGWPSSRR